MNLSHGILTKIAAFAKGLLSPTGKQQSIRLCSKVLKLKTKQQPQSHNHVIELYIKKLQYNLAECYFFFTIIKALQVCALCDLSINM